MLTYTLALLIGLVILSTCFIESVSILLKRGSLLSLFMRVYALDQWLRLACETVWQLRYRYTECLRMAQLGKDRKGREL